MFRGVGRRDKMGKIVIAYRKTFPQLFSLGGFRGGSQIKENGGTIPMEFDWGG